MSKHVATAKTRASIRTFVQALIPTALLLGVAIPAGIDAVIGEAGHLLPEHWKAWLLGASAAVAAAAAVLARIMAIPAVNELLGRLGLANDSIAADTADAE